MDRQDARPSSLATELTQDHDDAIAKPLLCMRSVTRVFQNAGQEVAVLRDVSMALPRGVFVAIKGRSGSGKTTLLNLAGGLDRPSAGEICLHGQRTSGLSDNSLTKLRRKHIGCVFQSSALLPIYTALENVEIVLRIAGLGRRERVERARRCLRAVGLGHWIDHRPDEMSGGQQQRVAIARALATHPDMILADEPTSELDTSTSQQILGLFREIARSEGIAILATTHDPHVDDYVDLSYTLHNGQLDKE